MTDHSSVSIRREMHDEVKKAVSDRRLGYSSVAEFAKEAIRLHLHRVVQPNIQLIVRNRLKGEIHRRRFREIFRE